MALGNGGRELKRVTSPLPCRPDANVGTFGLVKIQNADVMPDRAPLFGLPLASKEQFLASLKKEVLKSADFPYGCS